MEEKMRKEYIAEKEKHKLIKRLNIVEGQVRGIKQMIDVNRKCEDILIQIVSINKALKSLGQNVLRSYIDDCINNNNVKNGNLDVLNELFELYVRIN